MYSSCIMIHYPTLPVTLTCIYTLPVSVNYSCYHSIQQYSSHLVSVRLGFFFVIQWLMGL